MLVGWPGEMFFLDGNNARPHSISIIARSLSRINRYNGHGLFPYSVAQHSVALAKAVRPEFALEGLLHDAHEAFTGDVIRPIKQASPELQGFEKTIDDEIRRQFSLPEKLSPEVEYEDRVQMFLEMRHLFQADLFIRAYAEKSGLIEAYEEARQRDAYRPTYKPSKDGGFTDFIELYKELTKHE